MMLEHIDELDASIGRLDEQVSAQLEPFRGALRHLDSIPGVGARTAEVIIAETGGDMTRFPSPAQLSSWAGLCPGNNESAGKHHSGRSRPGNVWLAAALGEAAVAASHTKNTYLGARYARLAHRRGRKRATQAVARSILEAAWQVLTRDTDYADLGPDHWLTRTPNKARRAERLLTELRALGYSATLNPAV
jgi:transposase